MATKRDKGVVGGQPGQDSDGDLDAAGVLVVTPRDGSPAYVLPAALRDASPAARAAIQRAQWAVQQQERALSLLDAAVADMRKAGLSWGSIGWVVGISQQAAMKRWKP